MPMVVRHKAKTLSITVRGRGVVSQGAVVTAAAAVDERLVVEAQRGGGGDGE